MSSTPSPRQRLAAASSEGPIAGIEKHSLVSSTHRPAREAIRTAAGETQVVREHVSP